MAGGTIRQITIKHISGGYLITVNKTDKIFCISWQAVEAWIKEHKL